MPDSVQSENNTAECILNCLKLGFYYATIAYHVGLNAVLGLPHPGPTS